MIDIILEHELRVADLILRVAQYTKQPISEIKKMDVNHFERFLMLLEQEAEKMEKANGKNNRL